MGLAAGAIAKGQRADLVSIDLDSPALDGTHDDPEVLLAALVLGATAQLVRDVFVGGRRVVEDGRHPGWKELKEDFSARVDRVFS